MSTTATTLDDRFWSNRYINKQTGWDIGMPSPAITSYMDGYANKQANILIPGCGNAHEAAYLVAQGFQQITLLDISEVLVQSLRKSFNHPAVRIIHGDFFNHFGEYDLILEQTFFCALDPQLRPDYALKMNHLLKPGGKLVGLLFNRSFEGGPPFGGDASAYRTLFAPLFKEIDIRPCHQSIQPRAGAEVWIELKKAS